MWLWSVNHQMDKQTQSVFCPAGGGVSVLQLGLKHVLSAAALTVIRPSNPDVTNA